MKLKPYPKYRDSGVPWLGDVPEHWEIRKLGQIGFFYSGLSGKKGADFGQENHPLNKPYIPFTNIFKNRYINSQEIQYVVIETSERQNKVQKGDLFFLMSSENYEDLGKCALLLSDVNEMYLNSFCKGFRITESDTSSIFLNYQLSSKIFKFLISKEGNGFTRINLKQYRLRACPVLLPPLDEQQQIARYLDWKTAQINKFIRNKRRLIQLLKEQKQNIINQAVTKGINPNVEMKDSGVEWLGQIPAHWEVRRLKHCICGKLKYGANASGTDYSSEYPRYIRITDFNSDGYLDEKNKLSLNIDRFEEYLLEEGDLLFARSGATVGKVFQCKKLEEPSCFAGYLIKAKPDENVVTSNFLYLYTQSLVFDRWKTSIFSKATIENIGADKYSQLLVVIPALQEQDEIVKFIEKETSLIDKTISRTEREIELIQEYRSRIVSDVVTGKLDVRGIEIPDFEPVEADLELEEDEESEGEEIDEDE
jgi:Restriction endonuclease S subunits